MPDRTIEELRIIRDDFLVVKRMNTELKSLGRLYPQPLNGKTWQEERNDWFDQYEKTIQSILESNQLKSCEINKYCELWLRDIQETREIYDNHPYASAALFVGVEDWNERDSSGFSKAEALLILNNTINGNIDNEKLSSLENLLDEMSNCHIASILEKILQDESFSTINFNSLEKKSTFARV